MKLYELNFADPERGIIRVWKRNKREIASLLSRWKKDYPLRKLMTETRVDISTDKSEFVEWLNDHAGGNRNE
ncbi:MAG: hypothetical protein E4G74_00275 [Erysipelotrichales bacterium]|nr:MAG: hypothetical protein E4G74_00275 [Erysipelotrichales bacterium]